MIPHHHDFRAVDDPAVVERFGEAFLRLVPDGVFVIVMALCGVFTGAFSAAQKKLAGEILTLFEKTRALDCDVFRLRDRYRKTGNPAFSKHEADLLKNTVVNVDVHFQNVR